MKLAIVGSRIIPPRHVRAMLAAIDEAVRRYQPDEIISGGAAGVDTMAAAYALGAGIPCDPKEPEVFSWEDRDGKKGFKSRNVDIANACDALICLRAGVSNTYGSGWTADFAESRGKIVKRLLFDARRKA